MTRTMVHKVGRDSGRSRTQMTISRPPCSPVASGLERNDAAIEMVSRPSRISKAGFARITKANTVPQTT